MKPSRTALYNGISLFFLGLWGFIDNNFQLHTGLVPISSGLLFILFYVPLKQPTIKWVQLVQVLTASLAFLLFWPFKRNAEQADITAMLRVGLEILSCVIALFSYYRYLRYKTNDR